MTTTIDDLASLLKTSTTPRLKGDGDVWRLDGTDRHAQDFRSHFLGLAARFPSVFVHYDGGQPEEPSLQLAKEVARNVWRLPQAATGHDLATWLYMGNWQLYARKEPLGELRDLCRATSEEVRHFIHQAAVSFIVDSFHDDTQWTIGLQAEPHDA